MIRVLNKLASLSLLFATITAASPYGHATSNEVELVLQSGHSGAVTAVRFSPDGRLLVSSSEDKVIIWDVATGNVLRVLFTDSETLTLAISRDGNIVVCGAADGSLTAWDVRTGKRVRELQAKGASITSVNFSPRGDQLVSADSEGRIKLWKVSEDKVSVLTKVGAETDAVVFSPDGLLIASGGADKLVRLWDAASGKLLRVLRGHSNSILQLAFSSDGESLISGDGDIAHSGEAKLWLVRNGRLQRTFPAKKTEIIGVAFADKNEIIIMSAGGRALVWDESRGTRELKVEAGGLYAECMSLSPDKRLLAVGGMEGTIALADSTTGEPIKYLPRALQHHPDASGFDYPKPILSGGIFVGISAKDHWLVSGTRGDVHIWDTSNGIQVRRLSERVFTSLAVAGSGSSLVTGEYGGKVSLWNLETGQEMKSWLPEKSSVEAVALSSNGEFVASAARTKQVNHIRVWKKTGLLIGSWDVHDFLPLHDLSISSPIELAFSSNNKFLATRSRGENVLLWTVGRLSAPRVFEVNNCGESSAAFGFSSDSQFLAAACGDRVLLWNLDDSRLKFELRGHSGQITALVFNANATYLASTGTDRTIKIWRLDTGTVHITLNGSSDAITSIAFGTLGDWLVSTGWDGLTRIWNTENGHQIGTLLGVENANEWLLISKGGYFDGSPESWSLGMWRFGADLFDLVPLEIYFSEFYRPGLLSELVSGRLPPETDIRDRDRTQPTATLVILPKDTDPNLADNARSALTRAQDQRLGNIWSDRIARIELEFRAPQKASGKAVVRDARLFRNGVLIKAWRGDHPYIDGKVRLSTLVSVRAGENAFTAYGFNKDDVKSLDAHLNVLGSDQLVRKGVAYIVAVGIDHYQNPDFNLRYAGSDATAVANGLEQQLKRSEKFESTRVLVIKDENATKDYIVRTLQGLINSVARRNQVGSGTAEGLSSSEPEDFVFMYFAGHGIADGPRYYIIPHDLGYMGKRALLSEAEVREIERRSISDEELGSILESIDADSMALVIDACNSGRALESEETRRGPMNSEGLVQLAYEKGMYVLTASQSYQAALESSRLKHGLLTYALMEQGLRKRKAIGANGSLYLHTWFEYASLEVPKLGLSLNEETTPNRGFGSLRNDVFQSPRVFYRRELLLNPFIIAPPESPNSHLPEGITEKYQTN